MKIVAESDQPVKGVGNLSSSNGRREGQLTLPGHPEPYVLIAERGDAKVINLTVKRGTWIAGMGKLLHYPGSLDTPDTLSGEVSVVGYKWLAEIVNPTRGEWTVAFTSPRRPWGVPV